MAEFHHLFCALLAGFQADWLDLDLAAPKACLKAGLVANRVRFSKFVILPTYRTYMYTMKQECVELSSCSEATYQDNHK